MSDRGMAFDPRHESERLNEWRCIQQQKDERVRIETAKLRAIELGAKLAGAGDLPDREEVGMWYDRALGYGIEPSKAAAIARHCALYGGALEHAYWLLYGSGLCLCAQPACRERYAKHTGGAYPAPAVEQEDRQRPLHSQGAWQADSFRSLGSSGGMDEE